MMMASGASAASSRHHLHHDQHIARQSDSSHHVADGRPSAWCGWECVNWSAAIRDEYNLARNWAHGRRERPGLGVVVMPHHVFKVIQVLGNGTVLAISGNDSHGAGPPALDGGRHRVARGVSSGDSVT